MSEDAKNIVASAPSDDTEIFDWLHDDSIVVRSQQGIAVYTNSLGDVVIRREQGAYEEEDACVVIGRAYAIAVAEAILASAGHGDCLKKRRDKRRNDNSEEPDATTDQPSLRLVAAE